MKKEKTGGYIIKLETNRSRTNDLQNIANGKETLISGHRTFADLKKSFPDEIEEIEEALKIYLSEEEQKILKTEVPDELEYLGRKMHILVNT